MTAFIDGFNVYWGLRDKGFKRFYWLDYQALARHFVREWEVLAATKYFTTRVTKPADSRDRQTTYLNALELRGGVEIIEGRYRSRTVKCRRVGCGESWDAPEEKMTDVAIATHMVRGALLDEYDTAVLICADADLVPAVRAVCSYGKSVVIVSPRGRTSDDLAREGSAHLHWDCPDLADSLIMRPEWPSGGGSSRAHTLPAPCS